MFTVYALYSPQHQKIYIGYTSNLEERIKSHNELGTKGWTVRYRPWTLVHTETFATKGVAMAPSYALQLLRQQLRFDAKI